MTIIDHRILIPTSPETVWGIISSINDNPKWQADCQAISFLTSLRSGPGMRWRYTSPNGSEYVIETTAWYDGLGYEYIFVDGAPFREFKGTLRLQEIPEGTIVQWTLNYEATGLIGGVRNALGVRRSFSKTMVESLKALYAYIKETGGVRRSREARSLMRDALDYEARAQYVPRHPSRYTEREPTEHEVEPAPAPAPQPALSIPEPPVSEDDTRPNPALVPEAQPEKAETTDTPEEWQPQTETPAEALARFQRPPLAQPIAAEPQTAEPQPEPETPVLEEGQAATASPEPVKEVQAEPAPQTETPAESEPSPTDHDTPFPNIAPAQEESAPIIDTSQMDTREISIWQVFGVTPPSETDRMKAITDQDIQAASAPAPAYRGGETRPGTSLIVVSGFRIRARRTLVKLRRRA